MRGVQVRRRRAATVIAVLLAAHPVAVRLGLRHLGALRDLQAQGLVARAGLRWSLQPRGRAVITASRRVGFAGMTDALPHDPDRPPRVSMTAPDGPEQAAFLEQFLHLHAGAPVELTISLHPGLHHHHLRDTVADLLAVRGVALVQWRGGGRSGE